MKKMLKLMVIVGLLLALILPGLTIAEDCGDGQHAFGDWGNNTATCTADGTETRKCTKCGKEETRFANAKGHQYGPEYTTPATCTTAGETYRVCTVCTYKASIPIPAGHKYQTVIIKAANCTENGSKQQACSVCSDKKPEESIPALGGNTQANGHDFGDWVSKESNCKTDGSRTKTCKRCGYAVTENLGKGKHKSNGKWYARPKPSLEQQGVKVQVCEVCGKVIKRQNYGNKDYRYDISSGLFGVDAGNVNSDLSGVKDRLVPISLTEDGDQFFALITNDGYCVGKVVASVEDGRITVRYQMNDPKTVVKQASFRVFGSVDEITKASLNDVASMKPFGSSVKVDGDQVAVLVARLVLNYDVGNSGNYRFDEVSGVYIDNATSNSEVLSEMEEQLR